MRERRPNLATIVGSSLAVVAAGSLLAFSSLAEQAGLQGLAVGGIEPAAPSRAGETRAIRLPAPVPATSSETPVDPLDELVRQAIERAETRKVAVAVASPEATDRPQAKPDRDPKPKRPAPAVGFAAKEGAVNEVETSDDGPPYGHAYGHYKNGKAGGPYPEGKAPGNSDHEKKDKKKQDKKKPKKGRGGAGSAPVYARTANDGGEAPGSNSKSKKVKKHAPGNGANSLHAPGKSGKASPAKQGNRGNGHGKKTGHAKHGKGKGKGHSKHGH